LVTGAWHALAIEQVAHLPITSSRVQSSRRVRSVTVRRRRRQQGGQGQVQVDDDSYNLLQPSPLCCAWRGETRASPPRLPSAAVRDEQEARGGGGTVCRPLATNRNTGHLLGYSHRIASHAALARWVRAGIPAGGPSRAPRGPHPPSLLVGLVFVCSAGAGLRARTRLAVAGSMASPRRRLFKFDRKRLAPRDA
jgi:hypothetical protein